MPKGKSISAHPHAASLPTRVLHAVAPPRGGASPEEIPRGPSGRGPAGRNLFLLPLFLVDPVLHLSPSPPAEPDLSRTSVASSSHVGPVPPRGAPIIPCFHFLSRLGRLPPAQSNDHRRIVASRLRRGTRCPGARTSSPTPSTPKSILFRSAALAGSSVSMTASKTRKWSPVQYR